MGRLSCAMLVAAFRPQLEMDWRQSLAWGEKFLDSASQRLLRAAFEYQGSNLPLGVAAIELARHRRCSTRYGEVESVWRAGARG